ncbi:MAG: PrsW family intramembrane metalloprotease [Coriobacteriia bacterium]|nr:PrsW family intramembrane metalloprotease [Coriobacteriia bacterium]
MIDPKAILTRQVRRGVPTGVIISITASSTCLALFLILYLLVGGLVFFAAAILSVITLVPMMAGVLALDRLEPEPWHLLIMTFLWGAGASIALSLIFSGIGVVVLQPGFGESTDLAGAVIVAPVVEEIAKALVLFGLFWFRRCEFNGVTDGVVYAAMCGLGFAAAENIAYYVDSAFEGVPALVAVFVMRGVLSPFCHPVFTAMTGIGLALALNQRSRAARFFLPLAGLTAAMMLHALWNASASVGVGALAITFFIMNGVVVCILVAVRVDRKHTVGRIQACMTQYLPTGLVTHEDLAMLSSLKNRKLAREWALNRHGKGGFNAMRDYQQACTELTMLHDRAIVGMVPPHQFEAHQNALLYLMRVARDAFLGPGHLAEPMMHQPIQNPL